ncbi:MAG TPA: class IV adenylate cyclase [Verrucomicrobiae bacterium]|nr:class IV adenylate cyclase [Verrucomicrobiae bacterium]
MPRNVEIKARVRDRSALLARAQKIGASRPVEIVQEDTFFACSTGRLKLRAFSESHGELIFYRRPDSTQPKESQYTICPTSCPSKLRELLASALGECGRVRKKRTLLLVGKTRIHIDEVEGLGDFAELEVVLSEKDTVDKGIAEARQLMRELGISEQDLVDKAYVDLLKNHRSTGH